ncbi:MAG: TetR family transcriptional regulator [Bifidobacteriaceae bacterium]|nr:TetR family transcriptional regulator [Bifidobacteriaceae bacterium]
MSASEPARTGPRGRGRRPGASGSRDKILGAALAQFAERGYAGTSLRSIGRAAEVDPSLVTHYFGTKEKLFAAALEDLFEPLQERVARALRDGAGGSGRGRGLAQAYLSAWEDPGTGPRLRAVFRAASASPLAADLVRHTIESKALVELGLAGPGADMAVAEAFMSQLAGVAFARYILEVRPLADLPLAAVLDLLGREPELPAAGIEADRAGPRIPVHRTLGDER